MKIVMEQPSLLLRRFYERHKNALIAWDLVNEEDSQFFKNCGKVDSSTTDPRKASESFYWLITSKNLLIGSL